MAPRLFKSADVCEMAQLQPYVLRSWEKEFPGIGVQRGGDDSARLYRQSDIDQVMRIKQLVFSEGLTLAGARRRLEEMAPSAPPRAREEESEVLDALASNARTRIANVRHGLQSLLSMLSGAPGTALVGNEEYQLEPPAAPAGRPRASSRARAQAAVPVAAKKGKRA
jgi:DNA-binding transcriptional MerR regulator